MSIRNWRVDALEQIKKFFTDLKKFDWRLCSSAMASPGACAGLDLVGLARSSTR